MSAETTKKQRAVSWANISATLLGWPLLIVLFGTFVQKTFFTATCTWGSWKCEHSFLGSSEPGDEKQAVSQMVYKMAADMGYLAPSESDTPKRKK